ncbi:hypothetical protein TTHERM_00149950 (macronuclear) [Tetrahymena thermophila SB210]|uniref:Uncharacterized protein n=1 Tax=Tetrahymena thermophila (strain SB210) TaxID=312017 RepID=I7MGE6_TETTS|nr:hypothetical protein TTHERM_00149950 [Tetrahymena thermophila SB210]EAS01384.1 hypothetical protein TTHERM_00149950 [Tetrahymena thermophila SB210]|eukprot:XP_001021630.1 hypothetical protein TTHERM_00149950 [Tetrahymena thermophila SB210]
MFIDSQVPFVVTSQQNTHILNQNDKSGIIQANSSFQQQANEIKNAINNRRVKTIADCLAYQPVNQQQTEIRYNDVASYQRQQFNQPTYQRSVERCPIHEENINVQVNPNIIRFNNDIESLVVVEKSNRSLKKTQYETELRNLRKTNSNLENQLQDIKEFNYNMKSSLKQINNKPSLISSTATNSNAAIENKATLKKPSIPLAPTFVAQNNNQQLDKTSAPNQFDNTKLLSSMVQSVTQDARHEALKQQEDGDEVRQFKMQKIKEEEKRQQIIDELEKENNKLKNKAIRAQYEAEENEEKIKQLENEKTLNQKDVKNKQKDIKLKENEILNLQTKKSKIESEITSSRLVIKDKESEIARLNEKHKLNASERQKVLKELELHIQKRNIANLDYEKIRQDKDRIMEELEKRQVDANDKYNELHQKYLNSQNEIQGLEREITVLQNFIEEEKKEIQKLQMQHKILKDKLEEMETYERKLRKKEKTILSLESELEMAKREKKIEIVEKVVEKPVVIEKPVVVEKEVVIKEEVKVDEPLEKELAILREELVLLDSGLKEKTSEAEYWKKRFQDQELQGKHNVGAVQDTYNSEKQQMQIQYEKGIDEIKVLQGKLNALLAEIHTLSNINITKNREIQDQLHHLIKNNQSLENLIVANTSYNSIPISVQIPISSRYVSYH